MPPEIAKLLFDMKTAAERIERFTANRSLNDYLNDEMLRSAVERQFEIIGEAMTRLVKRDQETAAKIADYKKIAGFRNALIHGYDSIDDSTSWRAVTTHLPILALELDQLLKE